MTDYERDLREYDRAEGVALAKATAAWYRQAEAIEDALADYCLTSRVSPTLRTAIDDGLVTAYDLDRDAA